jgi:peroxiredoxin
MNIRNYSISGVMRRFSWGAGLTALVLVLAAFVLVQNITLLREVRMSRLRGAATELRPGRTISKIGGLTLNGEFRKLAFPMERDRLLVITLSPDCPTCRNNQAAYNALAAEVRKRPAWSVVWISRGSPEQTSGYATDFGIPAGEVLTDPLHATHQSLGLEVVPQMAIVDRHGVVIKVWQGTQPWSVPEALGATPPGSS